MSCIPWCMVSLRDTFNYFPQIRRVRRLISKGAKIVTHAVEGAEILLIKDSYLAPVVTKQPLPQYLLKITITKFFI